MVCKHCGAAFRRENLMYCPYCDMEIYEEDNEKKSDVVNTENEKSDSPKKSGPEWDLDKLTETYISIKTDSAESCGTVKIMVKGNTNLLSPATGTNYVLVFDGGAYQVRLTKGDQDISEVLALPVGKHEGILKVYSWSDSEFKHPETPANGAIAIDVKENMTAEIAIRTGALMSSRKIEIKYY